MADLGIVENKSLGKFNMNLNDPNLKDSKCIFISKVYFLLGQKSPRHVHDSIKWFMSLVGVIFSSKQNKRLSFFPWLWYH